MRVGVISDTHGLLRPEAIVAMRGFDHILHAGDIGDPAILDQLRRLAPLTAIRGNIDSSGRCAQLAATEWIELAGHKLYLLHDINKLDLNPVAAGIAAIISGHSHRPSIRWREGVLYFNPGSAGPRRFKLPISVGILEIKDGGIEPRIVNIG